MSWPKESLRKVAPPRRGPTRFSPSERVWHVNLDQIEANSGRILEYVEKSAAEAKGSTCVFERNDVLYSKLRPYLNKVVHAHAAGIATSELVPLCPNRDRLDPRYLTLYLRSNYFVHWISSQVAGAKMPRVQMKSFWDHKIPLPPLAEQKRIAHVLGKVEALISQRRRHLEQLDDLLKSIFLDMFGDPIKNPKGWERRTLGDVLSAIESGKSPKCEPRPSGDGEWGILKLGAVTKCTYLPNENKALPDGVEPLVKHEVEAGDILFSRKNTYDLVAACAYVYETRPKLLLPDLIFRLVISPEVEVNPIYLWKLLVSDSQRQEVQSFAGGAAGSMPNISKANLRRVTVPIPPLDLQHRFAAIVEKVEQLKARYQQSATQLEDLYGALSQRFFTPQDGKAEPDPPLNSYRPVEQNFYPSPTQEI